MWIAKMGSTSQQPDHEVSEAISESDPEDSQYEATSDSDPDSDSDSETQHHQEVELPKEDLDGEQLQDTVLANSTLIGSNANFPDSEEVDRDDPLLIASVRARLNRIKKIKRVGHKTVEKDVSNRLEIPRKFKEKERHSVVDPRSYQREAFKTALAKNTILLLKTGAGKTLVAVLLMKAIAKRLRLPEDKRVAVFIVPTVLLVQQQKNVIETHTDFKVGEYYGSKGVDTWSKKEWEADIAEHEVLMMTPQILLNILQHGFFTMDKIELLIFDECHHAQKNHPYAQIMKSFYHDNSGNGRLPKIFGMTASPLTKKGVKSSSDAAVPLSELERVLDSEVFTVKDREEVESVAPTPDIIEEYYSPPDVEKVAHYKMQLEQLLRKYEEANELALGNNKIKFHDQEELIDKLRKKSEKFHRDLQYCLDHLGLWCAYKAAEHWMKGDLGDNNLDVSVDVAQTFKNNRDSFLKEAMQVLRSAFVKDEANLGVLDSEWANPCTDQGFQVAVERGLLTPKVYQLVPVLIGIKNVKDVKCIIFVQRRVAAVVLASLVNSLECLSKFFCGGWMSGSSLTREQQQRTLDAFREGKVNLLVATDVAEEGLDVQGCSAVLRFDLPKTPSSLVQSRGRARQHGSSFIVLLERNNATEKDKLLALKNSTEFTMEQAVSRKNMQSTATLPQFAQLETYRVYLTGSSVNTETSMSLIARFCGKLPGDKYYSPKPEYLVQKAGSEYECILNLPQTSPVIKVIGPSKSTPQLAKQAAALKACEELHQAGALNDHLVPTLDPDLEEESIMKLKDKSGTGTTQQKELYPVQEVLALTGTWHTKTKDALLHAYLISFDGQPNEDKVYADFVLLIAAELDGDVARIETVLYITFGRQIKAKLSPKGAIKLTSKELEAAMLFQDIFFNGMFSKPTASIGEPLKRRRGSGGLPLSFHRDDLWNSKNMYLILPALCISGNKFDVSTLKSVREDVRKLEKGKSCELEQPKKKRKIPLLEPLNQVLLQEQDTKSQENFLCLAGGNSIPKSELVDAAVLTIHTRKVYHVLGLIDNLTAISKFPEGGDGEAKFKNYVEFFKLKHGQLLQYPNQPLLALKQVHRAHNLLPTGAGKSKGPVGIRKQLRRFLKTDQNEKRSDEALGVHCSPLVAALDDIKNTSEEVLKANMTSQEKPECVEMPPELCLNLGFPASVIRSAYLLPSVMYRLKSVMLASQLRQSIHAPKIPVMMVLEALTTTRCNEEFNMEALELFGDSFLKYAVSRKLFVEFKSVNEGILSARRMHRICNKTLHRLAVKRGLTGYIRDCPFDPNRWAAPGMSIIKEVQCHCKDKQMYKAFVTTTSTVVAVFGNEAIKGNNPESHNPSKEGDERTETIKPRIGLTCDNGHRYLCSKTVADVLEALIGAYLVEGSYQGALDFMDWAGIDVKCDSLLTTTTPKWPYMDMSCDYGMDVENLEQRLDYRFKNKCLLLEAMTHASDMGGDGIRCYQRLEFLGDAVLDFLLTQHLFNEHKGLTPGLLTKLRSASVNNERYARVAVKHKLHIYLRHGSGLLFNQIGEFVRALDIAGDDQKNSAYGLYGLQGPKVLGDLVESIAGAILVDTSFNVDAVWRVMKPLLSPIVTPDTLILHPVSELEELCKSRGYHLNLIDESDGERQTVTIRYEVKISEQDVLFGTSCKATKKAAKKDAAHQVLKKLEDRGYREKVGKEIIRWKERTGGEIEAPALLSYSEDMDGAACTNMEIVNEFACDKRELIPDTNLRDSFEQPTCVTMLDTANLPKTDRETNSHILPSSINMDNVVSTAEILMNGQHELDTHQCKAEGITEHRTIQDTEVLSVGDLKGAHDVFKLDRRDLLHLTDFTEDLVSIVPSVNVISASPKTPDAEEEHSPSGPLKRILCSSVGDLNKEKIRTKFHWSQEETEDTLITTSGMTTKISEERCGSGLQAEPETVIDKSNADESVDLLNFCPWTGRYISVSTAAPAVQEKSTTTLHQKEVVEVQDTLSWQGQPKSTSNLGITMKPCSLPSLTEVHLGKKREKTISVNSRQVLNDLRMKNKWVSLVFNAVLEEGLPHRKRFLFSLKIDTGKEVYVCQGEPKMDKKQAQESAAISMLAHLTEKGIIRS